MTKLFPFHYKIWYNAFAQSEERREWEMIGYRLYLLRKAAGLSQAELGDMLSVSHHTISAYEKEKSDPSDATKVWLARFFGVSVDYLMGLSDEPYPGYAAASSDVLLLPEGLTEEQRSAVQDYALFLAERNG